MDRRGILEDAKQKTQRIQRANYCHLDILVEIDKCCFRNDAIDSKEFTNFIRNYIVNISYYNERIVGYIIYKIENKQICIVRLCVLPEYRKMYIGKQLISSIRNDTNKRVFSIVKDNNQNLDFLMFLKSVGFKSEKFEANNKFIYNKYFNDGADAIMMVRGGINSN